MPRDIDAATATAAAASIVRPVTLAELAFDTGTTRLTNAPFNIPFDSDNDGAPETFLADQGLGTYGKVSEATEQKPYNLTLAMSGILAAHISLVLQEKVQGRRVTIWQALLDDQDAIIGAPWVIWQGRMDFMTLDYGPTNTVILNCESRLADWERSRTSRLTNAQQQALFPGDKGLEFVAETVDQQIVWGTF